jgi:hypothetical protein
MTKSFRVFFLEKSIRTTMISLFLLGVDLCSYRYDIVNDVIEPYNSNSYRWRIKFREKELVLNFSDHLNLSYVRHLHQPVWLSHFDIFAVWLYTFCIVCEKGA